ncbi:site-specific integrase [Dietzia sp. SLG510A3-30A2]|nr:site-specific integrase [Dietzia sp. SLG510A3-30A2]
MKASGATKTKAENALKIALRDRRHSAGSDTLKDSSTVAELLEHWITAPARSDRLSPQTLSRYRGVIDRTILPGLGSVRLREATSGRIEAFLRAVPAVSARREARGILRQAFAEAARLDAVPVNPVLSTTAVPSARPAPRSLTVADLAALRERIAAWNRRELDGEETGRQGPARGPDMADMLEVLIGSGVRIGELLALRWCDVVGLDDEGPVTVTVAGTLVEVRGEGIRRQGHPKSRSGHRTVVLPEFAVAALRRQRARGIPSAEDLVFPGRTGGPRWPANVRTAWRAIRGDEYAWVKPHTFRRTVATLVEREAGLSAATAQLGHSGTAVTERHYVERAAAAPDLTRVLGTLSPADSAP